MQYKSRLPADVYKELRRKAEEFLRSHESRHDKNIDLKDFDHLILELDVYQTELELQNEELREVQQKLEVALEKYADLYDFGPAGYLTLDKNGLILELNLTASRMLGIERRQIVGKPFAIFVDKESKSDFYKFLKTILLPGSTQQTLDLKIIKRDGNIFYGMLLAEVSGNISYETERIKNDNETERIRIILEDISDRKKLEEELVRKNHEMEDYAYRFTHDIKTPLINVYTYLELIEEDPAGRTHLLSIVKNQIRDITVHIDKILDLSRAGKVIDEMETLSVKNIITSAMSVLQTKEIPHKLICTIKADGFKGNLRSIYVVFLNLLENAFKYRNPNKELLVIEILSEKRNGNIEIIFKDNGIGISSKDYDKIFQPGYSVYSKKGTGFGLSIVEKIIKAHNGKITVKSPANDEGTEFTIVLPVS